MSLFVIGDPHLSFGVTGKKMDKFGSRWKGHEEKLRRNWMKLVSENDTAVIAGDLSWGRNLDECAPDFEFIKSLPGRKILLRGNHDMYWEAKHTAKLNDLFAGELFFLQNNYASYGDYALVGTKGYCFENLDSYEHFRKIQERETERLRVSFEAARAAGFRKYIVFLHYPPTSSIWPPTPELCEALGLSAQEERRIRKQEQAIIKRNGGIDLGHMPVFDLRVILMQMPELAQAVSEVAEIYSSPFTRMAEEYGAEQVIYAHSHGKERFHDSLQGEYNGIMYRLASGDFLDFRPLNIL